MTSTAVLVILLAFVFSGFRVLVLLASDYADDIEQQINQFTGIPVSIEKLDADIEWLNPRLKLLNVNFLDTQGKSLLHADEINLSLNWLASLQAMQPVLGIVSLAGTELNIQRHRDGYFIIQGFPLKVATDKNQMPEEARQFLSHSSIFIHNSRLSWFDQKIGQKLDLRQVELAMLNNGDNHQLSIRFQLPAAYGESISLRGKFQGNLAEPESLVGYLYAQFEHINMQTWFNDYGSYEHLTANGILSGKIWLAFKEFHIERLSSQVSGQQLQLHIAQQADEHQLKFDQLSTRLQWQTTPQGWQLQLDDVQIQKNHRSWAADSRIGMDYRQTDNQLLLSASFLRSEDVLSISRFTSHFISRDLKQSLAQILPYAIQGDLVNMSLWLPLNTPQQLRFSSQFKDLGFTLPEDNMQVVGIDGKIDVDAGSAKLLLDSRDGVFSMSTMFRNALELKRISGELRGYKSHNGWHIQSDSLSVETPHIKTLSRMEFIIDEQNNIFSNLHTYFEQGDLAYSSRYLPASIMDASLVEWLDEGIIKGHVKHGKFMLYGELNRFPFEGGEGVMQVVFDIENGSLKYMPDWPQIDDIQAHFLFTEKGMWLSHGQGSIGQAEITDTQVSIENFLQPVVNIETSASGQAKAYLTFVKNSGLNDSLAYIADFEAKGNADLVLSLSVPLEGDEKEQVKGKIIFHNNEIVIPSEGYRFSQINGQLFFTDNSVSARDIKASIDGYPLNINIQDVHNAGEHYTQVSSRFKAPVKSLLGPVPELRDYLTGVSDWDVNIKIPLDDSNQKVSLQMLSNLYNIASTLPAPFGKSDAVKKKFKLDLSVFGQSNLSVSLTMDNELSLSANREKYLWLTEINSPVIRGRAFFADDFSRDRVARIDLEYLDLTAYMNGSDETLDILPAEIPPLNLRIDRLKIKDWNLFDVDMQTSRNKNGMYIQQLKMQAEGVKVQASGEWMSHWRQQTSRLDIKLDFKNLGKCLKSLNLSNGIRQGKGRAELRWQWTDAPYNFSWDLLQGEGEFNITDGRLNDINAGAGRLLGVLNFKTLLSLDFGNQVKDGFPFDEITGNVKFDGGNAFIKSLKIDSKVADIDINGRIGLSEEDFDQTIMVRPGVGSSLTLIGAVAGGPVTAVWVHLFQKLFGVDEIAEYKYTVTGSWDDPQVKLIAAPESPDQEFDDDI